MRKKDLKSPTNEGLADLAQRAEMDHEVQMARADLYKLAKYSIKLHEMLKGVSEAEGIMGWQQAKITKAADYISSVFHSLDHKMKFEQQTEIATESQDDYIELLSKRLKEEADSKVQRKSKSRLPDKKGD